MKIGIPRALLYYYYGTFWLSLFRELGIDVVVSLNTTKSIVDMGVKNSVPEICVPIKIFFGHIVELVNKNVDYIFIPRMESIKKGEFFCPKFMGLPDMVKHSNIPGLDPEMVLQCNIKAKSDDISNIDFYRDMFKKLGVSKSDGLRALKRANAKWHEFRENSKEGYTIPDALDIADGSDRSKYIKAYGAHNGEKRVRIGLVGYVYNIYDNYVSMNIIDKLRAMDIDFLTFEMLEEEHFNRKYRESEDKKLFWTFTNKLAAAGYGFFKDKVVDGIIHVTAFGCGPDSWLGKLFELKSDESGIPFMTVRVDEHTGENH